MTAIRRSAAASVWRVLVGPPLRARDVSREQITPVEGLSALSLDALTSVAYGPEAIIVVLAVAGATALHLVLPITIAIELRRQRLAPFIARVNITTGTIAFTAARLRDGLADEAIRHIDGEGART